ncbi:MAG: type II secretion system GspH family protein [Rhodocyclaceae bacterium]|nr:type II secretion system GspH family protein [Rhodocyclaceae bacterium]
MKLFRNTGFTLTELVIVLSIVGALLVLAMPLSSAYLNNERRSTTTKKLANIELALLNFAITNQRLPCPAVGTLAIDNAGAGLEGARDANGYCTNGQSFGVVPWKAIGIAAADTLDSWNNQITYRVGYNLTVDNSLDMSACDPAGTRATAGTNRLCDTSAIGGSFTAANYTAPANFLINKGLNLSDGAALIMDYSNKTGAAYVLISHGENVYGALGMEGTEMTVAAIGVAGTTLEEPNRNLIGRTIGAGVPIAFINAPTRTTDVAATYFDDIVAATSVMNLINKAQLGPRTH